MDQSNVFENSARVAQEGVKTGPDLERAREVVANDGNRKHMENRLEIKKTYDFGFRQVQEAGNQPMSSEEFLLLGGLNRELRQQIFDLQNKGGLTNENEQATLKQLRQEARGVVGNFLKEEEIATDIPVWMRDEKYKAERSWVRWNSDTEPADAGDKNDEEYRRQREEMYRGAAGRVENVGSRGLVPAERGGYLREARMPAGVGGGGDDGPPRDEPPDRGPERREGDNGRWREWLFRELHEALMSEASFPKPMHEMELKAVLRQVGAPEGFHREAMAYLALMNAAAARKYFSAKERAGWFYMDDYKFSNEMDPSGNAAEWRRLFLHSYEDKHFRGVLQPLTREGGLGRVSEALKSFTIDMVDSRSARPETDLSEFARMLRAGNLPEMQNWVEAVAGRGGMSTYEASVARLMCQFLVEADYYPRDVLAALTMTSEHADVMRSINRSPNSPKGIWWGSSHWWDPDVVRDFPGRSNALPKKMWTSLFMEDTSLRDAIVGGTGAEKLLEMAGGMADFSEGRMEKNQQAIKMAAEGHKKLTDISEATESSKMDARMLFAAKKVLLEAVKNKSIDLDEAKRVMEAASRIFFREMSVLNPSHINSEKEGMRLVSPRGLFAKFTTAAVGGEGNGLFEFTVRGEGLDAFRRLRAEVLNYMQEEVRRYKKALPMDQQIPFLLNVMKTHLPNQYISTAEVPGLIQKSLRNTPGGLI